MRLGWRKQTRHETVAVRVETIVVPVKDCGVNHETVAVRAEATDMFAVRVGLEWRHNSHTR